MKVDREAGNRRAKEFIARAMEAGSFSFDVEHNPKVGPHDKDFKLHGIGFSTEGLTFYETESDRYVYIMGMLFPTDIETIAYNAKYDIMCVKAADLVDDYPNNLVDPMVGINLLDDNRHYNQLSLEKVVEDYWGETRSSFKEASARGLDSDEFMTYACNDARDEYNLWKLVKPRLEEENLWPVFSKILMPVSKVFADIEHVGIGWDLHGARKLLRGYQKIRDALEKEIYEKIGKLNLDSPKQLAERLFNELGYSPAGLEMTPKGDRYSVDAKAMDKLAAKYPVCEKIKYYRTANKMIGTYVEPITRKSLADPKGRVHPTYWIVSTTGRTRSEKPNFQNIPAFLTRSKYFKHLDIRSNVVPQKGRKLIVADLSQIELRLVAHITQDSLFLRAYRDWKCHICGAAGSSDTDLLVKCPDCGAEENEKEGFWHGLDLHQITADNIPVLAGDRQLGKICNFALVYCATPNRMHYEHPSVSVNKWRDIIEQFFDTYTKVRHWHLRMERCLWDTGLCVDIFGRRRRIPMQIVRRNPKHALNMLVNFSPQASACAMLELAMVKLREYFIKSEDWLKTIWPTNMVHDEIVFEVTNDKVDEFAAIIRSFLETPVKLHVPVRADIKVCENWGQAK